MCLNSLNFQNLALNKEFTITIQNCKVHDANFLEQKPTRDCDNLILSSACTGPDTVTSKTRCRSTRLFPWFVNHFLGGVGVCQSTFLRVCRRDKLYASYRSYFKFGTYCCARLRLACNIFRIF